MLEAMAVVVHLIRERQVTAAILAQWAKLEATVMGLTVEIPEAPEVLVPTATTEIQAQVVMALRQETAETTATTEIRAITALERTPAQQEMQAIMVAQETPALQVTQALVEIPETTGM